MKMNAKFWIHFILAGALVGLIIAILLLLIEIGAI